MDLIRQKKLETSLFNLTITLQLMEQREEEAIYHTHTHTQTGLTAIFHGLAVPLISKNGLYNTFVWPSVLWPCWLGGRKGIQPVRTGEVLALLNGCSVVVVVLWPLLLLRQYEESLIHELPCKGRHITLFTLAPIMLCTWTTYIVCSHSKVFHTHNHLMAITHGNNQSQWRRANFDPQPPLNPLTIFTKICIGDYVGDIYHPAKFYSVQIRGIASAHARLRAPLLTRLFFGGF